MIYDLGAATAHIASRAVLDQRRHGRTGDYVAIGRPHLAADPHFGGAHVTAIERQLCGSSRRSAVVLISTAMLVAATALIITRSWSFKARHL